MHAKSLMVMGTASDVGKSVIVTALCRSFARAGRKVAPFKAQNMSNNAAVCPGGGEIGRAQAVQAEAAGLAPSVAMNPVLLKPGSDMGSQVVIGGRPRFFMNFQNYERYRTEAWPAIKQSYESLATRFELVVIEGAGGAAEINLRDRDIVNWPVAELANAPVLLVGDIDRGGVFASLVGTVELLASAERQRLKGFVINKFRGDIRLLETGLGMLEERTGIPVLGVLPYCADLGVPQEDAVVLYRAQDRSKASSVVCAVLHFPHIANFTDFEALNDEPDVTVHYLRDAGSAPPVDVIILPGTKSTVADLAWLRTAGWEEYLKHHCAVGGWLIGICGGYQMLGRRIIDREQVESIQPETTGLGLLPTETTFQREKIAETVRGFHRTTALPVAGYEIHAGRIRGVNHSNALFKIVDRDGIRVNEFEGIQAEGGRVIGSSIHGLFDTVGFRRCFINQVRASKGLPELEQGSPRDSSVQRPATYDRVADWLERHVDMHRMARIIELG